MMPRRLLRWVLLGSLPWQLLGLHAVWLWALVHQGVTAPGWLASVSDTLAREDWLAWNARADAWSFTSVLLGCGLCARAAWFSQQLRQRDLDWLRTRPASAGGVALAVWTGLLLAALAWLMLSALWIESRTPASRAALPLARIESADALWIDASAPQRVRLTELPAGETLSLSVAATRGAPQVTLQARWIEGELSASAQISSQGRLTLPMPSTSTAPVLELSTAPEGTAVLWAPRDSYVLCSASPRATVPRVLLSWWIWISVGMAVSLIAGLWMRASLALALGTLALLVLAASADGGLTDEFLRRGWLPHWPPRALLFAGLAAWIAAPLLGAHGLARARRRR
jgi:hypothetical protein